MPRISITAAAVAVSVHALVMLVHGAAHMRLNIELSLWAAIYVLAVVGIGPIAGLLLLRSRRQRAGATVLFTTMAGALVFGLEMHFFVSGPDHIMHLEAGVGRVPFQATAVLLVVSEFAGAIVAFRLFRVLTRQSDARTRHRGQ